MLQAVETTPQVDTENPTAHLEDIQSSEQRTQTIPVTSRIIAIGEDGEPKEVDKTVKVFVRPMPFKRWFTAIQYIQSMLGAFPQVAIDFNNPASLGMFAMQLLGDANAEVIGLMSLATDRDEAFFDTIDLDEGLKIILAVIEVNKDFFVQKVLPMVKAAAPEIITSMQETFGQTP